MPSTATIAEQVIAAVSRETGVSPEMIRAPSRSSKNAAWARMVAVFVTYKVANCPSWSELGRTFGRDRTTMRHAVKTVLQAEVDLMIWRLVDECSAPAL